MILIVTNRSDMKERPILFSAPMVRALLAGTKTQTRRIVKLIINTELGDCIKDIDGLPSRLDIAPPDWEVCPYGQPGDLLWVRETWQRCPECEQINYAADRQRCSGCDAVLGRWKTPIFMPRTHSRILLEITAVRVERLQDINEMDAKAEGVSDFGNITNSYTGEIDRDAVEAYEALWESINGAGSWDVNPWVWVIEFKRIKP